MYVENIQANGIRDT